MPVQSVPGLSRAVMSFEVGVDAQGQPLTRNQSLNNIKYAATDQAVFDVLNALSSLQTHVLAYVQRVDEEQLLTV